MKIVCLTVGKKHDPRIADGIAEYLKRLQHYADFSFEYIPPSNVGNESENILKKLTSDDKVILLDESGQLVDNRTLSDTLNLIQNQSVKRLYFIIGGAYGVSQDVFNRSDYVISFSMLVFPHQLMRLLLVEQLYRSFNLLAGGKYHHD